MKNKEKIGKVLEQNKVRDSVSVYLELSGLVSVGSRCVDSTGETP